MSEPPPPAALSPEHRRRLTDDAVRSLRLLADALEQAGARGGSKDAPALLAQVQAAVQPLRASPAVALNAPAAVTAGGSRPAAQTVVLSAAATLKAHDSTATTSDDGKVVTASGNATATATASGRGHVVVTGSGSATSTVTAQARAEVPVTASAEDVPSMMWEILLKLDDMSWPERELSPIDITNWITAVINLLSVYIALLKMM